MDIRKKLNQIHHGGILGNATTVDYGLLVLRVVAGLAFIFIFEKVLPREGVWGPQARFIQNVTEMGFPFPVFFAWVAVLSEFLGGFLMVGGLWTRYATFMNASVTFVAAFVYHDADLVGKGLTATVFFSICVALTLAGPGRFSIDGWLAKRSARTN